MGISGTTVLAGVVGWPVDHSRSPRMHNAAYGALGLDRAYVPLPVPPGRLEAALRGMAALGFAGVNVTIPHKPGALASCDTADASATRCGGANTVVVGEDGRLAGHSTDGEGMLLAAGWNGVRDRLAGRRAAVLGAGGAAAAAVVALLDAGASSVTVCARRGEAASALVDDLAARTGEGPRLTASDSPVHVPVMVNATPVGQRGDLEALPVEPDVLRRAEVVVDLAYRGDGEATALVAAARAAGAGVVDGLDVLAGQGVLAFRLLTGVEPPVEVMREAARGAPEAAPRSR
jgi:shikimate dehydrogenase